MNAAPPRRTLPERFFLLEDPPAVDRLLATMGWCAVFKAATGDRTFDAWDMVQRAFEPRVDVAVGLIQIPAGRAASNHLAEATGVVHKSPQVVLCHDSRAVAHLSERDIRPEALDALIRDHLPAAIGPRVVNELVVSLAHFRSLLDAFVAGTMPEERFQWAYLERLAKEAAWRDDDSFAALASLFDYPWDRGFAPARVVAHEFQGQLAGRLAPLRDRARLLTRLATADARNRTCRRCAEPPTSPDAQNATTAADAQKGSGAADARVAGGRGPVT